MSLLRRILKRQLSTSSAELFKNILIDLDAPAKILPSQSSFLEICHCFDEIRDRRNSEGEFILVNDLIEYIQAQSIPMVKRAISIFCTTNEDSEIVMDIFGFTSMVWSYCPTLSEQYFYSFGLPFGVADAIHLADKLEVQFIQSEYDKILYVLSCWWKKPKRVKEQNGLADRGCPELNDFCSEEFHSYAHDFVQRHNRMFYPAYELQRRMRETVCGDLFWKLVSSKWRRKKSLKESYCRWRLQNIVEHYVRYNPEKDIFVTTTRPRVKEIKGEKNNDRDQRRKSLQIFSSQIGSQIRRGSLKTPEHDDDGNGKESDHTGISPKSSKRKLWPFTFWKKSSPENNRSSVTSIMDSASETDASLSSLSLPRASPNQSESNLTVSSTGKRSKSIEVLARRDSLVTNIKNLRHASTLEEKPLKDVTTTLFSKKEGLSPSITPISHNDSFFPLNSNDGANDDFLSVGIDRPLSHSKTFAALKTEKIVQNNLVISSSLDSFPGIPSMSWSPSPPPQQTATQTFFNPPSSNKSSPRSFQSQSGSRHLHHHRGRAGSRAGSRVGSHASSRASSRSTSRSSSRSPSFLDRSPSHSPFLDRSASRSRSFLDRSPDGRARRFQQHPTRPVSVVSRHVEMRDRSNLTHIQVGSLRGTRDLQSKVISPQRLHKHSQSIIEPEFSTDNSGDILQSETPHNRQASDQTTVQKESFQPMSSVNDFNKPSIIENKQPLSMGRHSISSLRLLGNTQEEKKVSRSAPTTPTEHNEQQVPSDHQRRKQNQSACDVLLNMKSAPTRQKIIIQDPL